jgi:hypothetical protein
MKLFESFKELLGCKKLRFSNVRPSYGSNYVKQIRQRGLTESKDIPIIHFVFWHKDNPEKILKNTAELMADIERRYGRCV